MVRLPTPTRRDGLSHISILERRGGRRRARRRERRDGRAAAAGGKRNAKRSQSKKRATSSSLPAGHPTLPSRVCCSSTVEKLSLLLAFVLFHPFFFFKCVNSAFVRSLRRSGCRPNQSHMIVIEKNGCNKQRPSGAGLWGAATFCQHSSWTPDDVGFILQ